MNALHVLNVIVVVYNLTILLPAVWRYGFDWKLLALVCAAITCCVASSIGLVLRSAS